MPDDIAYWKQERAKLERYKMFDKVEVIHIRAGGLAGNLFTTIALSVVTRDRLTSRNHGHDTYDDVLTRLLDAADAADAR